MLVKCDKCGQSYEVNDSRISPQGAKIKCPSCANIFIVRPPAAVTPPKDPTPAPMDSQAKLQTPIQPKTDPKPAPVVKEKEQEWRIQHIGLTYTFHDLESLHNWLAGRPSLEGVKIARDSDDWKELGDYPDVMTTELITKFFPLGDVPTSKSVKAQANDKPAEKEQSFSVSNTPSISEPLLSASALAPISAGPISKATDLSTAVTSKTSMQQLKKERAKAKQVKQDSKKQLLAFGIVIALLVVVGIFVMRYWRTGEIPFMDAIHQPEATAPQTPTPAEQPTEPVAQKPAEELPPPPPPVEDNRISYDEIERLAEEDYQRQLAEAKEMVSQRKWPEARTTLESMYQDHLDDPNLLQLLAKTYRGLGMNDKASAMDTAAKKALAAQKELEKKRAEAIHIGDE